jgi:hypothetical protein
MPILSISYDLHKEPSRVYTRLIEAIKSSGSWCKASESVWLVNTTREAKAMYDLLKPHLHVKDRVLVTRVTVHGGWWTQGQPQDVLNWLRASLSPAVTA